MTNEERLAAIKTTEAEIRAKKERFRDPEDQPPSLWRYSNLEHLKHRATVLYAATAMVRNRLHFKGGTLEDQQEFVDKYLPGLLSWMGEGHLQRPAEIDQPHDRQSTCSATLPDPPF